MLKTCLAITAFVLATTITALLADPPATQPQGKVLPNGSIAAVVSEKTTRFTAPLNPDGTVNYVEALDSELRKGVTKENNFALVLLEVYGPASVNEKIRGQMLKRLGLDLPDQGDYFRPYKDAGVTASEYTSAGTQPWRAADHPTVNQWLKANQEHLDRLASGAKQCPRFYVPLVSMSDPPGVYASFSMDPDLRGTVSALRRRAMLQFGTGNFDEAQSDLDAIGYLSRLSMQRPLFISWLVGAACEVAACDGYQRSPPPAG